MSERKIKGSQWWWVILAFLAGIAVHAGASSHRPQTLMAAPTTSVAQPVAYDNGTAAQADSDICGLQLD
jgi:hypothetical protein